MLDKVYLLMYEIDTTHETVKGVYSSYDNAQAVRWQMLENEFGDDADTMSYCYWIIPWDVDK